MKNATAPATLDRQQLATVSGGIGFGFGTNGFGLTGSGKYTKHFVWNNNGLGYRF